MPFFIALPAVLGLLFVLGPAGAHVALVSPGRPEPFGTEVRAAASAFCTAAGRGEVAEVGAGDAASVP